MDSPQTNTPPRHSRLKKAGFAAAALTLFALLFEGCASVTLVAYEALFWSRQTMADRSHTRYDADLGWVGVPDARVADIYGPGLDMTNNARGFRGLHEVDLKPPPGKVRVVCSGDSFTLGYGVGDEQTWCSQLGAIDDRLETVNMGQGGYGIDQAYLWYMRDGKDLEHQVHLLAFITDDFRRMQKTNFWGYDKPVLALKNDQLIVENTPVPRRTYFMPWLTENMQLLGKVRTFELIGKVFENVGVGGEGGGYRRLNDEQTEEVVAKLFKTLQEVNQSKNSTLVVIYMPYEPELYSQPAPWQAFVKEQTQRLGIVYIDLVDIMRKLPRDTAYKFFLHKDQIAYPGAAGHFSAAGNLYVAEEIHRRLLKHPVIAKRIEAIGDRGRQDPPG